MMAVEVAGERYFTGTQALAAFANGKEKDHDNNDTSSDICMKKKEKHIKWKEACSKKRLRKRKITCGRANGKARTSITCAYSLCTYIYLSKKLQHEQSKRKQKN